MERSRSKGATSTVIAIKLMMQNLVLLISGLALVNTVPTMLIKNCRILLEESRTFDLNDNELTFQN
jgi:hypothetical protein